MAYSKEESLEAKQTGKWGEAVAAEFLTAQGYGILEQNWRMGHLEVDIIAQKGDTVAFVEVKTRSSQDVDPLLAVDKRKRARMTAAADAYMRRYQLPFEFRFDIINITGSPDSHLLEHIPDAFMPALKSRR